MAQLNVGPYNGVTLDEKKTYPNGRTLRFIAYSAYNASGLIGTENNGVAILDEDNKSVVCDNLGRQAGIGKREPSIFNGLSTEQVFQVIRNMDWQRLSEMVNKHPRTRYALEESTARVEQETPKDKVPEVFFKDIIENKAEFGAKAQEFLRNLAQTMKLKEGTYDIRYNAAGPACSGEATLHADNIYVQVGESFSSEKAQILYRKCESRNDYCGGDNHYITSGRLKEMSIPEIGKTVSSVCKPRAAANQQPKF